MATLKHQIAISILMLFALISLGQKMPKNYLLAFRESSSGTELWGFKTISGRIAINPKYEYVLGTDTLYDIAFVTLNHKRVVINRHTA